MPPLHVITDVLVNAVLPAALAAAVLFALLVTIAGKKASSLAAALGLAAGVAVGLWRRDALTLISPDESPWNRLSVAALGAMIVGLISRLPPALLPAPERGRRPARTVALVLGWLIRLATIVAIAWWVIPPKTAAADAAPEEIAAAQRCMGVLPAFAGLIFAQWLVLEPLASRPPGGSVPLLLALCAFTGAGVLIHAGSARLTDAATVLSAALGGIALVAAWRGLDAGAIVPAAVVFLAGLMLMGFEETYHELSWPAFALPAAAPLTLVLTVPFPKRRGMMLRLARIGLMLVPLAAAVALAMEAGPLDFGE